MIFTMAGSAGTWEMTVHTFSLKERQRQQREQLILQAAEEVLAEQGYDATSMEEIASRVGISRAAIYLHFPSKEDLVFAVLERGIRTSVGRLEALLAEPTSPREKVEALIQRTYRSMAQPSSRAFATIAQSPAFFGKVAEKRVTMHELWSPSQMLLTRLIEEGKRCGDFDPEMPTALMVTMLTGLITPFTYRRMIEEEGMPPEVVVKHLCRYFLKGIAPDTAAGASTTPGT